MKVLVSVLISILSIVGCVLGQQPKTVMLVLGSADMTTLKERIEIAYEFQKNRPVDRIIVSGGCGAHNSAICEASIMAETLIKRGVDKRKIFKEENAKTTVQNYVFSRILCDEKGEQIIQPKDTVFVVSNHWHAMSVAARCEKYDNVVAYYHIQGNIKPKANDKADYVGILNGEKDNGKFVLKGTWPTPDANWYEGGKQHLLFGDLVYITEESNDSFTIKSSKEILTDIYSYLPQKQIAFIDNGKYWLVKTKEGEILQVDKTHKNVLKKWKVEDLLQNLPQDFSFRNVKAGLVLDKTLWLFSPEEVVKLEKKGNKYIFQERGSGTLFTTQWPFSWGKSNVSHICFNDDKKEILIFRNMELMKMNYVREVLEQPIRIKLKWIE